MMQGHSNYKFLHRLIPFSLLILVYILCSCPTTATSCPNLSPLLLHCKISVLFRQVSLAMSRGISQQDGSYKLVLNATYHYRPVSGFEDQYSVVVVLVDDDKISWRSTFINKNRVSLQHVDCQTLQDDHSDLIDPSGQGNTYI